MLAPSICDYKELEKRCLERDQRREGQHPAGSRRRKKSSSLA